MSCRELDELPDIRDLTYEKPPEVTVRVRIFFTEYECSIEN